MAEHQRRSFRWKPSQLGVCAGWFCKNTGCGWTRFTIPVGATYATYSGGTSVDTRNTNPWNIGCASPVAAASTTGLPQTRLCISYACLRLTLFQALRYCLPLLDRSEATKQGYFRRCVLMATLIADYPLSSTFAGITQLQCIMKR